MSSVGRGEDHPRLQSPVAYAGALHCLDITRLLSVSMTADIDLARYNPVKHACLENEDIMAEV